MKTDDFFYNLPPERIAQRPIEPRDRSRLMVIDRTKDVLVHGVFNQLGDYLQPGDLLVLNQTRVIPARLYAHKPTGGKVEILLLRRQDSLTWEALIGGKKVRIGTRLAIDGAPGLEVVEQLDGSRRLVKFDAPIDTALDAVGQMPLPPYIHERLQNPERYQTVFAKTPGSAAAPTAGLHFTQELIALLEARGVRFARVTLHVGLDTFAPVNEENPQEHIIHTEWCELTDETAQLINQTHQAGGRVIAVGTTSVRTLESAARNAAAGQIVGTYSGATDLFILPGYTFRVVDAMITNFHLPRSTLLMLVSAFAGREKMLAAYQEAVQLEYRFFSFGDAMLIV